MDGSDDARLSLAARVPAAPALFMVALLNSTCYPLITIGLGFAPPFAFATLRALIAGLTLAMLAVLLRLPTPREPKIWFALAAIGLATTSLGYLGMFHAAEFVAPGLATVIANSQPLAAALLAQFFLRERLSAMQRVGLFLGFAGIVVVSLPKLTGGAGTGFAIGLVYIVLAAGGLAAGNVLMKALGARVDPIVAMAAQLLFGSMPLGAAAMLREHFSVIVWTPEFILSLLGLALPGTALTYWLWFVVLESTPLSGANAFTFLTPFFGYAFGAAFFGEHVGFAVAAGLVFTVAGIALTQRPGQLRS